MCVITGNLIYGENLNDTTRNQFVKYFASLLKHYIYLPCDLAILLLGIFSKGKTKHMSREQLVHEVLEQLIHNLEKL